MVSKVLNAFKSSRSMTTEQLLHDLDITYMEFMMVMDYLAHHRYVEEPSQCQDSSCHCKGCGLSQKSLGQANRYWRLTPKGKQLLPLE